MAAVSIFFADLGDVTVMLTADDVSLEVTGASVDNRAARFVTIRLGAFTVTVNATALQNVNIPKNRRPSLVRDDFGTLTLSGSGSVGGG